MRRRTFYIKPSDEAVFILAKAFGEESLSSTIAAAVRRLVEVKQAEKMDMKEYSLLAGVRQGRGRGDTRVVRFLGRELASSEVYTGQTEGGRDRGTEYRIYLTQGGQYLVWWRHWTLWENEVEGLDYAVLNRLPQYGEEVAGKVGGKGLPPQTFPDGLLRDAAEALGEDLVVRVE